VPARAAKMGSIAVDKAIAKLGTPAEFYQQLEPEKIGEHIVTMFAPEIPALVDDVMRQASPSTWRDLPEPAKRAVVARVQAQLPAVVHTITQEIGEHIDQLLDPKIMVIEHFRANPELVVKVFKDIGQKELNTMVNIGFVFGFLFGIPVAFLDHWFHQWWLLPVLGIGVGWATNLLGMWLIFEPANEIKIGPFRLQALFARRQWEASDVYGKHIAMDVITLERIGDHLLNGPSGDRTRQMLAAALMPAIDAAVGRGPAAGAVRIAVGPRKFDSIKTSVAQQAVDYTLTPLRDAAFSERQSVKIRALIAERCRALPAPVFVEMMRAAIKEDEWLLYAHGAIMGLAGGFIHLAIFGVG